MRILFFSYYNPLGKGGFEQQSIGLMKTLVNQGHEIACLTVATPENETQIKSCLEKIEIFKLGCKLVIHTDTPYSKISQLLFWLNTHPSKFFATQKPYLNNNIQECINKISLEQNIDLIHVLGLRSTYYLPLKLYRPAVLDLIDSMSLRKYRALNNLPPLSLRNSINYFYSLIDLWKTRKIEKDVLKIYSSYCPIVAISPVDESYLATIHRSELITSISAGIDVDTVNKIITPVDHNKLIVFYGFMQEHNIDALFYLIDDILPLVRSTHPNLELHVTGFNLPEAIFDLSKTLSWLKVHQSIDNIQDFVDSATLTCWPFRLGGGIKTKILESMALGKPVVTTTIGAEALSESQKEGILIADSAEGLAYHISYLLSSPEECLRLGAINHQVAITEFTWENRANNYIDIYKSAIHRNSRI